MSLDWAYVHHDRGGGPKVYATKRAYDYVEGRMSRHQRLVTAVVANAQRVDGVAVEVQFPHYQAEELGYLTMTAQENYPDLESARQRFIDLLYYQKNRFSYRKRTEMAVEIVRQLETEGQLPQAHDAFDNGVLSRPLTRLIEQQGKHWVSELESSRLIQWHRVDAVAAELRQQHPESLHRVRVSCVAVRRNRSGSFTKTVRLKRYGRKRLRCARRKRSNATSA